MNPDRDRRISTRRRGRRLLARLLRRTEAQALVETAISASLMAVMVAGLAECGLLEYDSIEITAAAHAGALYAAQSRTTALDSTGASKAALAETTNLAGATATLSHFCQCASGAASTCSSGDCSSSRLIEYVQVDTSATPALPFHLASMASSFTLRGRAVMRVGQ